MRFALDENTARWFRHALRPASLARTEPEFSEKHWKFEGKLRSVYVRYDTPWVKVTYGF